MKRLSIILSIMIVGVMLITACGTAATPTPEIREVIKTVEVIKEVEKKVDVIKTVEVIKEVAAEAQSNVLFWDPETKSCTKTVKLTVATHGDHQSRNQDALFGVGVLQNEWEALQPCVQVETQRVPQGTSPNIAVERWTAGTHADVVFTWVNAQQAGTENQWVLPLETYFDQKNPYSDNATWYEDFLYPEVFYVPHTDGHTYWVRPGIRPGSNGVTALFYNRDLLLAAGVTEANLIPDSWTTWFDNLAKCKALGKTGMFIPLAGNTLWEWSIWMVWWMGDYFSGNLADELYANMVDGTETAQGVISSQKLVKAVIEGKWDLNDPRAFEFFNVSQKLFDYIEPGYAAVPEMVAETPTDFLKGNVCYAWAGVWRVSTVSRFPNLPFTWGTVWLPKPDSAFSEFATDHYNLEQGASPATAEMVHMALSSTAAKDPDVVKAAVDFMMYATSPKSNKTWCQYQSVPCTEPGTSFDEIVGDNADLRMQLYGFYNPVRDGKYVARNTMVPIQWLPGGAAELNRRFTEYYEGKMSKEDFIKSMMTDIMLNAKDQCKHNLEVGVKGWEFCSDLPLD